jgi:hypothetical protein
MRKNIAEKLVAIQLAFAIRLGGPSRATILTISQL